MANREFNTPVDHNGASAATTVLSQAVQTAGKDANAASKFGRWVGTVPGGVVGLAAAGILGGGLAFFGAGALIATVAGFAAFAGWTAIGAVYGGTVGGVIGAAFGALRGLFVRGPQQVNQEKAANAELQSKIKVAELQGAAEARSIQARNLELQERGLAMQEMQAQRSQMLANILAQGRRSPAQVAQETPMSPKERIDQERTQAAGAVDGAGAVRT